MRKRGPGRDEFREREAGGGKPRTRSKNVEYAPVNK